MGLIKQPNATGIDVPIQGFQKQLYGTLKNAWGLTDDDWNCYDRAYRNQLDDRTYYPEVFLGSPTGVKSQEYREVLVNDQVIVQSFFGVGQQITYKQLSATAPVFLIIMISNLSALKPGLLNRVDEAVRIDAQRACSLQRYGFIMDGFTTGIDNVFREYSGWKCRADFRDIHPFHCFRINFSVTYSIQNC